MRKLILWLLGAVLMLLAGCNQPAVTQSDFMLDTFVTITAYGCEEKTVQQALDLCRYYDGIFNRHDESSELYRLNHANGETVSVSEDLMAVIEIALRYCKISDGRYDITISPVLDLWDFRTGQGSVPARDLIENAVKHVDYRNISLDGQRITLSGGAMIDLGSVAKGYIADQIGAFLAAEQVKGAVINLGGNILTIGHKPGAKHFEFGIQTPFGSSQEIFGTVTGRDFALVSSGSYERFFWEDNRLYHHIIDPDTGYPAQTDLVSVTILSDQAVEGDLLSTLCFLLGSESGMALIEETNGVEAIFVTVDNTVAASSGAESRYAYKAIS